MSILADFNVARDLDQLALLLGCSPDALRVLCSAERARFYSTFKLPKRNGSGHRLIHEPVRGVGTLQKGFASRFECYCKYQQQGYPHPNVHGFLRGSSTKTNAEPHCGSTNLLRVDLRSFFSSISRERVEHMLRAFGVAEITVPLISGLVTVPEFLAEGIPSSPLISNLVALGLDKDLAMLAERLGCKYTRYADDLSFSTSKLGGTLPSEAEIEEVVDSNGFEVARDKTRRSKPGQAHFVTGLSVQLPGRPTVPKALKRQLRLELHFASKFGIADHSNFIDIDLQRSVNKIQGRLSYLYGVEGDRWDAAMVTWKTIMDRDGIYPSYSRARYHQPAPASIYVDESVVSIGDQKYLCLAAAEIGLMVGGPGISAELHRKTLNRIKEQLSALAATYATDIFSAGRKKHLSRGLHHTDDHMDLQAKAIELIASMPVEFYVASRILDSDGYEKAYLQLLDSLLRGRLAARNRDEVELVIEENSHVKDFRIVKTILDLRPSTSSGQIKISIASKSDEPVLAIADYALGVLLSQRGGEEIHTRRFERLRHRYRYIVNLSAGVRFNRRNPLDSFLAAFPPDVAVNS